MESLICAELLNIGDTIQFTFKSVKIQGEVGHGGHILNTMLHGAEDPTRLYQRIYPSLTAWSEACLREGLGEENTRYASWKRVLHMNSGRTLQSLRSEDNVANKRSLASRTDLFEEINRLHKEKDEITREAAATKIAMAARLQIRANLSRQDSDAAFIKTQEMRNEKVILERIMEREKDVALKREADLLKEKERNTRAGDLTTPRQNPRELQALPHDSATLHVVAREVLAEVANHRVAVAALNAIAVNSNHHASLRAVDEKAGNTLHHTGRQDVGSYGQLSL